MRSFERAEDAAAAAAPHASSGTSEDLLSRRPARYFLQEEL
jgi:hypothetical protein